MSSSISFTAGGIDVSALVSGLMSVERQPVDRMITKQSAVKLQADAVGRLRSSLDSLRNVAAGIVTGGISKFGSSVSSPSVASVALSSKAAAGAVTFSVDRLARAHGMRSSSTVADSTSIVTTAASLALSTTTSKLGLGSASVDPAVAAGKYTVTVTQATVGAIKSGTSALATSTVVTTGVNDSIDLEIDGVARTLTLAAGTYTTGGLATAVQTAIDATGGGATASIDGGRLKMSTTHEGSAASVQVTGGSALTDLRFSIDGAAITGTDGAVQIGTNAVATVTSAGIGGTVAVATGTGDLTFDIDGGLRTGAATVAVVSTGDRSLTSVATAINAANVGATASAVKVSDGNWLLQLNSKSTGVNGSIAIDDSIFAGIGGLIETSAAQDAQITIGSGPGAYSVTSSSNTFTEVMPGVSITALTESATAVTASVNRNDNATADAVSKLIASVNSMVADINVQTRYNPETNIASPLTGDAGIRRLAEQVRAAVTSLVGETGSTKLASSVGIDLQRDGTIKFDSAKFTAALASDPDAVERLFARGGTTSPELTFAAASDKTLAGTYAIDVSVAAQRATTGVVLTGGSPGGQRIGVRIGSLTATYDAPPGATATEIADGLNEAMASAGFRINAEESGGGVKLTAVDFGAAASFETNLDITGAGSWTANTGVDVVGTVNGRLATGVGQRLAVEDNDGTAVAGLKIDVGEGLTGAIGSVTYAPGIAARLVSVAATAAGDGGVLTTSENTYDSRYEAYNTQIDKYEERLTAKEAAYRRQWTTVQTLLNSMQNQQSWLASQIDSLSASS